LALRLLPQILRDRFQQNNHLARPWSVKISFPERKLKKYQSPRDEGYATLSPVPPEDGSDATAQQSERWLEPGKVVQLPGGYIEVHDSHNYSYAYGPKGIAGLLHNRYVLLCALLASVGGLEFGYDQGVVSSGNQQISEQY